MKKQFVATGFVLLSFLLPLKAKAVTVDRLYVFGNSLSDTGNLFNLSKVANQLDPSIPITPPSPPYYQGRFSNGPIWVDDLASELGLNVIPSTQLTIGNLLTSVTVTPSGPVANINFNYGGATTTNSVDFSYGGAETGLNKSNDPRIPVGLLTEINSYTADLDRVQQSADPNALYVVEAGPNDLFDQVQVGNLDIQEAINNIETAVTTLADRGARNFLISNLSDLGKTPFALNILSSKQSATLTNGTNEFNSALATLLNSLSDKYAGINIIPLDVNSLFNQITGLTNVTNACTSNPTCLNDPNVQNQYLYWDNVHPTTVVHLKVAEIALKSLNSVPNRVPEPGSSLGILAFGALGAGLKLKNQRQKKQLGHKQYS